jgi:hypothetical protein
MADIFYPSTASATSEYVAPDYGYFYMNGTRYTTLNTVTGITNLTKVSGSLSLSSNRFVCPKAGLYRIAFINWWPRKRDTSYSSGYADHDFRSTFYLGDASSTSVRAQRAITGYSTHRVSQQWFTTSFDSYVEFVTDLDLNEVVSFYYKLQAGDNTRGGTTVSLGDVPTTSQKLTHNVIFIERID